MPHHLDRTAEATMESFWQYQEAGEFDQSISVLKSQGHHPDAIDFALNPDSYYFPNRRGDRLIKPVTVSEDRIPVVALENGKTYRSEQPSLHYLQRIALQAAGYSHWAAHDAARELAKQSNGIQTSGGSIGAASVYKHLVQVRDISDGLIESKPTVIFNAGEQTTDLEPFCAGIAMHEIVHVVQTLSKPLHHESTNLRKELEAYAVQACLVASDVVPYSLGTAMAGEVDLFRKKYLGADAYEPTGLFREELNKQPILAKIL